jgi:Raf kinase inhibitor-like YbhB/YbcL family protein
MFRIMSSGFQKGYIHDKYGKRSAQMVSGVPQISFPLKWQAAPKGTVSFAIVFQDYDNVPDEGFSWLHWLVCDIPSTINELVENASRSDTRLIQGRNSWMCPLGSYGLMEDLTDYYGGPAPEHDHEYEVQLIALDCFLDLKKGFYYNELRRKMEGHILGEAVLKGIYKG